jgi:hypothetical protein
VTVTIIGSFSNVVTAVSLAGVDAHLRIGVAVYYAVVWALHQTNPFGVTGDVVVTTDLGTNTLTNGITYSPGTVTYTLSTRSKSLTGLVVVTSLATNVSCSSSTAECYEVMRPPLTSCAPVPTAWQFAANRAYHGQVGYAAIIRTNEQNEHFASLALGLNTNLVVGGTLLATYSQGYYWMTGPTTVHQFYDASLGGGGGGGKGGGGNPCLQTQCNWVPGQPAMDRTGSFMVVQPDQGWTTISQVCPGDALIIAYTNPFVTPCPSGTIETSGVCEPCAVGTCLPL